MAALRGTIQGQRGSASRLGSKNSGIHADLATWEGHLSAHLNADGTFVVTVGSFDGGRSQIIRGNVNDGTLDLGTSTIKASA